LSTKADNKRLGYVGSSVVRSANAVENDDWYTPPELLDVIRLRILRGIDLDPFSSDIANQTVKAGQYLTADDDALHCEWPRRSSKRNRVFMNPPYSRNLCAAAVARLLKEYESRNVTDAVVLVNNMSDTRWFRQLVDASSRYSYFTGRIGFVNAAGQAVSGNTRGQTLFLLSKDKQIIGSFTEQVENLGHRCSTNISTGDRVTRGKN
jgi:ParB family chromosome partitioning protein